MDAETRGRIEKWIDHIIEEQDIPETVKLILREDLEVSSKEDLALGYWLGYIMSSSLTGIQLDKILEKLAERAERKAKKSYKQLEKTMSKEEFMDFEKKRGEMAKRMKLGRPIKVSLNEEEENEMRKILLSKISFFREKIRREPYR